MAPDLKDKTVFITGASTGIGAAAARAFASAGANVVIHYNSSKPAAEQVAADVRKAGAKAALVSGDVTLGDEEVRRMVHEAHAAFGRVDVLINNAGGMVGRAQVDDYTEAFLDSVLRLNVVQVALFVRHVVPLMRKQGGGNIINVTSIAARNGGGGGAIMYAAAKGFVSTATRGWAKELAEDHIRVNAVSPGVIATPFHERYSTDAQMAAMKATIPMKRVGDADECAGAFVFLASEKLSGYITGQVVEVNGGQYMP